MRVGERCRIVGMTIVTELDLPGFDYSTPDLTGEVYHRRLAELREKGWLAQGPLSYIVLDREAGEFFLRRGRPRSPDGRSRICSASRAAGCANRSMPTSSTRRAGITGGCARWSARRSRRVRPTGGGR
jgi:hypothetical protein